MAENTSSPEWLPTGWTTAVKTSKNGNKYKCYSDPANKFKFHSKPEVLRYLNSEECNFPLKPEGENDDFGNAKSLEKGKETVKRSEKNFVVEKAVADELPPGWIKEVKVTQRGNNIRRDSYYTDPASGYVFLSLKDSKRYLKTGILGKHAYKPKDKDHISVEVGDDNLSSPVADQGKELQDGGTNGQITENNKEILGPAIMEDHTYFEKQNSDQCRDVGRMSSLNRRNTRNLERREEKGESGSHTVSSPVVQDCPKKLLQNRAEIHKTNSVHRRINKSNAKQSSNLPRRASKRLAGVDLDPVPEVKTNTRICRFTARQLGDATASGKIDAFPTPEEHPEKLELETMASEQQVLSVVFPVADSSKFEEPAGEVKPLEAYKEQAREEETLPNSKEQAEEEEAQLTSEERSVEIEPANETDMKLELATNFSLADIWEDPCIEFAIKTLTGDIPIEEENKAEETSGSSVEMSLRDLWMDPCIEFAVKTLTGAIPLDVDLHFQNIFQQQTSTSETQGVGGVMLPTLDNFCQTEYISQHVAAVEKVQNKQQVQATSRLPHTSARSLQNSGGSSSILRQQMKDRNRP